jgi:signal peptidase I
VVRYDHGAVSINGAPFDLSLDRTTPAKPEDFGQVFVHETAGGRERSIKLDPGLPGGRVPPEAWLAATQSCEVASAQSWRCTVPAGKYLMMGDNRDNSADSRIWGFLDHHEVVGKAVRVLGNLSDLKRFWLPLS